MPDDVPPPPPPELQELDSRTVPAPKGKRSLPKVKSAKVEQEPYPSESAGFDSARWIKVKLDKMKQHPRMTVAVAFAVVVIIAVVVPVSMAGGSSSSGGASAVAASPPPPPAPPRIPGSSVQTFERSGTWELRTLVRAATAGLPASAAWPIPCARSYEGHEWEVVLPRTWDAPLVQVLSCSATSCELSVPSEAVTGFTYWLNTTDTSAKYAALTSSGWHDRVAAHLLVQGTFGPARADITTLSTALQAGGGVGMYAAAAEQWVVDQITTTPATLHRAYLRQRSNPRHPFLSDLGRPRGACELGARWSRIALRGDDVGQLLTVRSVAVGGGSVTALYVNGVLRSEVAVSELRPWGLVATGCTRCSEGTVVLDTSYTICKVQEWQMGTVKLGTSCTNSGANDLVEVFNVYLSLSQLTPPSTDATGDAIALWDAGSGDTQATLRPLSPATPWNEGVLLLEGLHVSCPLAMSVRLSGETILRHGSYVYRYDPRLVMLDNTIDVPANLADRAADAGFGEPATFMCPTVPKTFLNEATCTMTRGCLPYTYDATPITLDATTIRAMYVAGRTIALVLDNLPTTSSGQNNDPCRNLVRWRNLGGPCSAHGGESSMNANSRTVLTTAIRSSTDANANVKDVQIPNSDRSNCNVNAGKQVDVDGVCWLHTNPAQLNVYDMTSWALGMEHPGNDDTIGFLPIAQIARNGATTVSLPQSHFNDGRVRVGHLEDARGRSGLRLIGRLGDTMTFAQLPQSVRTAGLADALGITISAGSGLADTEQCGSPGEVADVASNGMPFYVNAKRLDNTANHYQQELLYSGQRSNSNTMQIVHTEVALQAADQLRQRVAWALSQVVVAAIGAAGADNRETWTGFYDIFVRHAFGSYRDVLAEVSWSPVMANWLTYMDNQAWAASGTVPDENYAREIMQLFSLGLWVLNDDGTQVLDSAGQRVPTYVNADIVSQARMWTGFTEREVRGNVAIQRNPYTHNLVDPMSIRSEWRDVFPKMNLYRGHVGDHYPLCTALGARHFLRAGATYRYLGKDVNLPDLSHGWDWTQVASATADNTPLFAPVRATSALYAALCNAAAPGSDSCHFQSKVVLSSHLACDGLECALDTARLVQVNAQGAAYYFEYVPPPCVSLAFLEGGSGRFVESIKNNVVRDKLCMEPAAIAASSACCTPRSSLCYEHPCNYIEERVAYGTALARCDAWQGAFTPPPPPVPSPPLSTPAALSAAEWMLYPIGYQREAAACPEGSAVASATDCLAAAAVAMAAGAEPHLDAPQELWSLTTNSQSGRPAGCIVKLSDGAVQFNTHATGSSSSSYKLVCSVPSSYAAFPAAANYTDIGGTGKLCSRKLTTCQTSPSAGRGCNENTVSDTLLGSYWWSEEPCRVQVQVHVDGRVARVDPGAELGNDPNAVRLQANSENWFRVRWASNTFPNAAAGCADSCVVHARNGGDTCLCDVAVATAAVFTDFSGGVPTKAQIEQSLFLGAPPPSHSDAGTYTECATAACAAASPAVRVFTQGSASSPLLDSSAIFAIVVNGTGTSSSTGRTLHLANKVSTVTLAHGASPSAYSFRNPPQMMTLIDATERDAIYETDALLDHLFYHQNVGPFLAIRLIQHLVTSNPSPRYVATATTAFRSGSHGGRTYSGHYGDMGAMVAAIMLDREARSLVLPSDPSHGHVREPLIKLLHLLRAMEVTTNGNQQLEFYRELIQVIGQAPYRAPSVFNFYQPEYSAPGAVSAVGLLSPEAQLGALPYVIGFLDGVTGMIFDGLSACQSGIFTAPCRGAYTYPAAWANEGFAITNDGYLGWTPSDASTSSSVIGELDLLLTAGHLDEHTKAVLTQEYEYALGRSQCPTARADLCGRLTPGQELAAGEHITNSLGETLCFTYDGVARHIGADGTERFSTATYSRECAVRFTYDADGLTRARLAGGNSCWKSEDFNMGNNRAFHTFLSGNCELHDQAVYSRYVYHSIWPDGHVPTMISCTAADTCALPAAAPPSAASLAERARTDAAYAVRVAQSLLAMSAAFATTNEPLTRADVPSPPPPARPSLQRPYKALIVFFMRGGADTFNLLVPRASCDSLQLQAQYASTRGVVGLSSTLEIDSPTGTQPCDKFGLHPELSTLRQLYIDGDAAFVANAGSLLQPVTKAEYLANVADLPPQLFAHNTQQRGAESLDPFDAFADGIAGRMLSALDAQALASGTAPLKTTAYAITSNQFLFRGAPATPIVLSAAHGMLTYDGSGTSVKSDNALERNRTIAALHRMFSQQAGSIYAETHNQNVRTALADSERIAGMLSDVSLSQNWAQAASRAGTASDTIVKQLEQVSRVIASRTALQAERDVFLVELGGFDTHADVLDTLVDKFKAVDEALATWSNEMKAMGVWQQVTLTSISDFARTMTTNGRGTDHAWGGNYFTVGGDVSGGKIHGTFPELRTDGPNSISGTGQMLPTTPWEAIWRPLCSWMGVNDNMMDQIMPNLNRFTESHLLSASAFFDSL